MLVKHFRKRTDCKQGQKLLNFAKLGTKVQRGLVV